MVGDFGGRHASHLLAITRFVVLGATKETDILASGGLLLLSPPRRCFSSRSDDGADSRLTALIPVVRVFVA
jgi:hypothetical protein